MKIHKTIKVPTGEIYVCKGERGKIECLAIGDYGKDANLKADFLGLTRVIDKVETTKMLPLEEKFVITISTQHGCSMGCKFCDVPKVGKGLNATYNELLDQIIIGIYGNSKTPKITHTERLNIHYARMGEPTFNNYVLHLTSDLKRLLKEHITSKTIHPVISTMLPKYNSYLETYLQRWMDIKNDVYKGEAGLQFSINSTSDVEREVMFSGNTCSLATISRIGRSLPMPIGRKITLNFAVAEYEIDAIRLRELFDPDKFLVKLTPMHKTHAATANNIQTKGDYTSIYPYLDIEQRLKDVGFDVIVFLASEDEDLGRITCGNAILSGSLPECNYSIEKHTTK